MFRGTIEDLESRSIDINLSASQFLNYRNTVSLRGITEFGYIKTAFVFGAEDEQKAKSK